jgi:hypothetical protein
MAVARTEHVICQRDRHPVDQGDDPMQQGFEFSQTERPAFGWSLLSEGLGRCPRRASSGFHPKRQTPFRVKNAKTVLLFRLLRSRLMLAHPLLAARQGCRAVLRNNPETKAMSNDVDERISSQITNQLESGARRLKPWIAKSAKERITHPLARDRQGGRQGVSHARA